MMGLCSLCAPGRNLRGRGTTLHACLVRFGVFTRLLWQPHWLLGPDVSGICTLQVYDATSFLKEHPGGGDSILLVAGTDATEEFDAIHSEKAKQQLLAFAIGRLATTPIGEGTPPRQRNQTPMLELLLAASCPCKRVCLARSTLPIFWAWPALS